MSTGAALFNIYVHYCSCGRGMVGQGRSEEMLSHQFAKLCKDAKLINNKNLTKADVDIIYHRCVASVCSVGGTVVTNPLCICQALPNPCVPDHSAACFLYSFLALQYCRGL